MVSLSNASGCKMSFSTALLLFASISLSHSFAPPRQVPLRTTNKPARQAFPVRSFIAQPLRGSERSGTTSLYISWPGHEEPNDSEGKRDSSKSRLKLTVVEANEAPLSNLLSDFTSPERIEEFVAPVSKVLDDKTGGWALSYANLEPETENTPIGISFLATNIAYGLAGSLLVAQGQPLLGMLTEFACVASFGYHYSQLKLGQSGSRIVRLALLIDYFFALSAIIAGSIHLIYCHSVPQEVLVGGSLAITSLGACWIWEEGLIYIIFHSLWHLFSAYTGYIIGSTQ